MKWIVKSPDGQTSLSIDADEVGLSPGGPTMFVRKPKIEGPGAVPQVVMVLPQTWIAYRPEAVSG